MEGWILVGLGEDAALSKGGPAPGPGSLEIPGSPAGHGRGGALVHAAPALRGAVARAAESAFELLSPTRCCGCERLGQLVCDRCLGELALIDPAHACLRCGAPYGDIVCTECAGDGAADEPRTGGTDDAAIARCLAMATYEGPLPRIVRAYKDAGERRLARLLAEMLLDCALHAELAAPERYGGILSTADAVCFVPATAAAFRRRGFDHMEQVARPLAEMAGVPLDDVLLKHGARDQRAYGRAGRRAAAQGLYEAVHGLEGARVLLVDDVVTTGATMGAAAGALRRAGAVRVDALALARVWGG
ncbi:MAG: ComF family protein [Collinsella sp.]|nr:ComF family protein [Collinsella sp.]